MKNKFIIYGNIVEDSKVIANAFNDFLYKLKLQFSRWN